MAIHYEVRGHAAYLELVCTAAYAPEVPAALAEEGLRRAARAGHRALLLDIRNVTGREPMVHPQRFGEIVATNRGGLIRVFTDQALALNWLLQKPNAG